MTINAQSATLDELRSLYSSRDDSAANWALWVGHEGDVHIDEVDDVFDERIASQMRFRWETWGRGNGYVGPDAAKDDDYMNRQLAELRADWAAGKTGYVDY